MAVTIGTFGQQAKPSGQPISVDPKNPHYLLWKNQPTVLVGSSEHFSSVIDPDFDFKRYLATVSSIGLNHTRIFLGDYAEEEGDFGMVDNPLAPAPGHFLAPWARSSVPGYALGGTKFDLDHWNPAYFERLHAFMHEAEERNIIVEVVFFFVGPKWDELPLNPRNNINQTTPVDHLHYLTLDNGNILARQEAYCRKLIRELNQYNNVIFNIVNEPWYENQEHPGFASQPPHATKLWIGKVSDWITDEESKLPKKHVISADISNQGPVISDQDLNGPYARLSIFNVHYDDNADSLRLNPNISRVFSFNETGFNGVEDQQYRTQGWNYMLSGGGIYDNLDFSFSVGHEDGSSQPRFTTKTYDTGGSAALRGQLKILLDFMNSIPFASMTPDNSVVVGGADEWRALTWDGHAYAIWFPGDGPIEPRLLLPAGNWRFEWVDILSGKVATEVDRSAEWVRVVHGMRGGGGVPLRIFPDESAAVPAQAPGAP